MNKTSLWDYFVQCITKKYVTFDGRARRREFWGYMFYANIFSFFMDLILIPSGLNLNFIGLIVFLFFLLPSLSVSVRRLQDIGKSGCFVFLFFIPILGAIVLLILFVLDSDSGTNEYGENPKGIEQ